MIVYETNEAFVMTTQHEHAKLSKKFAEKWRSENFIGSSQFQEVLYAIEQHDRSWVNLDTSPIWNDELSSPYSFIDYPLSIKLHFYEKGINEIENNHLYAALLCSIHYTNFFSEEINEEIINEFVSKEKVRQKKLLRELASIKKIDRRIVDFHYHLLKFCDSLSLFVCMQETGVRGEKVHVWFRNGIVQPFVDFKAKTFKAVWNGKEEILINPFPFNESFEVSVELREVKKDLIKNLGILKAFHQTSPSKRIAKISPFINNE